MKEARDAHDGVSFNSSRNTGLYMEREVLDKSTFYTKFTAAVTEEDWAVMNAVLLTFFLVLIFALAMGICCGVWVCAKHCGYAKKGERETEMAQRLPYDTPTKGAYDTADKVNQV